MKTLDEIKKMMAAGDAAKAEAALKEVLAKDPDNLQAKMLYGMCRQLLGDEESFRRIHDELAPVMERLSLGKQRTETITLWKKYRALWSSLIVGALVLVGSGAVLYFARTIVVKEPAAMSGLYGGPRYFDNIKQPNNPETKGIRIDGIKKFDD